MNEETNTESYSDARMKTDDDGWFCYAGRDFYESSCQEYTGNNCIFATGLISDESAIPACDTMYIAIEKDGEDALVIMLRPDEMAAMARNIAGALWWHLMAE